MLSEREWVSVVICASKRAEEEAKNDSPEFYEAYKNLVKQMEEDKKNGIKCTYDVGYDC